MKKTKLVFITGASRGIGRSIVIAFIKKKFNLGVGYCKRKDKAIEINKMYNNARAVKVDISNRQSIKKAVFACQSYFGQKIDILVNNAAIAQEKPFETITDKDWDKMMAVNLRGPFIFSQEVLPGMVKNKWGRIVNIVSIGGQWGGFDQVHYAAAKAGLINLTKSLAKIYSSKGITINAVAPGLVATDMSQKELRTKSGREKVKNIPIGRIATPDEIANVVSFLCSDDANYITGQTINVNGGMYFGC